VYDAFAAKLAAAVARLKVGNGLEEGVTQGPLIDMNAVAKVEEHIADAVARRAHACSPAASATRSAAASSSRPSWPA
jgi:acyl-CoA reductase-like NAD-dependent aldehyde dehydrogenase